MLDYGEFCYLDVQKTGSSFISKFLRATSTVPPVLLKRHASVRLPTPKSEPGEPGVFRNGTFYFNSVRNPLKYYASLYNYGCDKRGGLYKSLQANGLAELYDGTKEGFFRWCDFLLKDKNARYLHKSYPRASEAGIGFLTHRFLKLSVPSPQKLLRSVRSTADALAALNEHNICQFTIRNETLTEDLEYLIQNQLKGFVNPKKCKKFLSGDKINSSKTNAATDKFFSDYADIDIIIDRDRIIFEKFYPDVLKSLS